MSMYQEGYEYYVSKCEDFGLQPINFYYYVQLLSQEQLDAFNQQAKELQGRIQCFKG
ncbi:transcriptional regulator [Lysinibacillus telephonicus]|uniref:Transcriptional regulator n=1 Tax=Lysinibacillus telephonicus TaxID=1714840 RepID=A0A3S0IUD3_9BACI|nr:transcriptional regulator [Lysinibacillus telephonicus]RTQ86884.1 transcriptional regulator [Lysinibacillus telephonicus]